MQERRLNAAQQEAAEHYTGPALTLAGPGSGKTTVLTERTRFLAERTGRPEQILCVTFTNAAGEEMRRRYLHAAEDQRALPVFRTLHSFCNALIRTYEKQAAVCYRRIDEASGQKRKILQELYYDINKEAADPYQLNQIGNGNTADTEPEIKNIQKIRAAYTRYKRQKNLIDFDDMIDLAAALLHSDRQPQRAIREAYQSRFLFTQVDEAQDLTAVQFAIVQVIAASGNIFVVADDDQSIYGFRGALPDCVREFYRRDPECKLYRLSRNYRSTKTIVRTSERFIAKNTERFEKNLYSEREQGDMPRIRACGNSIVQATFVWQEIKRLRRHNTACKIGILYRNNISGLLISTLFTQEAVPFYRQGDLPTTDKIPFVDRVLQKIRAQERNCGRLLPSPAQTLRRLTEDGLEQDFETYCRKTRQHMRYKDAVLSFLFYICTACGSWYELVRLLDRINAAGTEPDPAGVCLSTVHSAKGLEYDAVFIIDALQGEFPGSGVSSGKMLEEERRLFYVAMTRARERLYVTYPLQRGYPGRGGESEKESIFVTELRACLEEGRSPDSLDESPG